MKRYEVTLQHNETGRIVKTIVNADGLAACKILIGMMFNIHDGESRMIGIPQEVVDNG